MYAVSGEREKAEQILNENLERWKKGKSFSAIALLYGVWEKTTKHSNG